MGTEKQRKKNIRLAVKVKKASYLFKKEPAPPEPEIKIPESKKTLVTKKINFFTKREITLSEETKELSLQDLLSSEQPLEGSHLNISTDEPRLMVEKFKKPNGSLFSENEKKGLETILQYRQQLNEYQQLLKNLLLQPREQADQEILKTAQSICDAIKNNQGISLPDGSTTLILPWSRGSYQACFEWRNKGTSFFIHNQGPGVEDEAIHGKCEKKGNQFTARTTVEIKCNSEVDRTFMEKFLHIYCSTGNIHDAYQLIKEDLLNQGCQIAEAKPDQYDTVHRNASSVNLPEKWLTNTELRKYLSLFSAVRRTSVFISLPQIKANPIPLNERRWKWQKESAALAA